MRVEPTAPENGVLCCKHEKAKTEIYEQNCWDSLSAILASSHLFEFFKAPLLDEFAAAAAAPVRMIADRALKKQNQEWELVGKSRVEAAWRDTLVSLLLNLFFIFQT